MESLLFLKYNLRALSYRDLKSPPKDFKPPNQSSLPNSEDQNGYGDVDYEYDGEESDLAISSDEEECA